MKPSFKDLQAFFEFVRQLGHADPDVEVFFEAGLGLEDALRQILAADTTIMEKPLGTVEELLFRQSFRIGVVEDSIMRAVCILHANIRRSSADDPRDEVRLQCLSAILDAYLEDAYPEYTATSDSPAILSNFEVVANLGELTSVAVTDYVDGQHILTCMVAAFAHQHPASYLEYQRILAQRDFDYVRDTVPSGFEDRGELSDEGKALVTLILRGNTGESAVQDARKWLYQLLHVRYVSSGIHARIVGGRVYGKTSRGPG